MSAFLDKSRQLSVLSQQFSYLVVPVRAWSFVFSIWFSAMSKIWFTSSQTIPAKVLPGNDFLFSEAGGFSDQEPCIKKLFKKIPFFLLT
jgi:hypothetical protein